MYVVHVVVNTCFNSDKFLTGMYSFEIVFVIIIGITKCADTYLGAYSWVSCTYLNQEVIILLTD